MTEVAERIVEALRDVYDPCCRDKGISVVDMGLLRDVSVDDAESSCKVELVLTTGWCPFVTALVDTIRERLEQLPEIDDAAVEVVWEEAWTTDRLSEDARRKLRFLPDPRSLPDRDAYVAAHRRLKG